MRRLRGSTSQRRYIFIADTSSTTGAGLANLVHNSSGLVAYYIAGDLNNEVQITLVSGTLGTFVSGGFVAVDNTNMPGWYEVGIPDAALDGGNQVAIQYRGATNMAPVNIYIELDAVDYQTDAFGALKPTTAGRTLDVTATGAAGIDWGNVENQGSTLNLSATSISTSQQVASVTGNVGGVSGVTFPTHFDNLSIDPNGHVTATVDAINNNAITASSIQANAFTSAKFAADSITASALATDAAVEIAGKVWDEALTNHLTNGSTGYALNNAGGSGNPWITDLATGYTGTQAGNILNQVKAKTDLITTGAIQSSIPVTAQGQITGPLFIGDDYLSANGRAFQWTVALPSGFVIATSTCRFGMEHAEGATEGASFAVSGTVTDAGGGNVTLAFSVPKATTGALKAGFYRWSVEIASASGNEVTRVASDGKKLVEWREKQT